MLVNIDLGNCIVALFSNSGEDTNEMGLTKKSFRFDKIKNENHKLHSHHFIIHASFLLFQNEYGKTTSWEMEDGSCV